MLLCYNKGCGKEYSENGEGKLLPQNGMIKIGGTNYTLWT